MHIQIELTRSPLVLLTFAGVGIFLWWPQGDAISVVHTQEPTMIAEAIQGKTQTSADIRRRISSADQGSFSLRERRVLRGKESANDYVQEREPERRKSNTAIGGHAPAHPVRTQMESTVASEEDLDLALPRRSASIARTVSGDVRESDPAVMRTAENRIRQARFEQDLLSNKEDILRRQLQVLEDERQSRGGRQNDATDRQISESTRKLTEILRDQRKTEEYLLQAFREMRDAQDAARVMTAGSESQEAPSQFTWPVEATLGISAYFQDASYLKRFGFPHNAIDIPISQGSVVGAAADGTVVDVTDNGLGFNSITIRHEGGVATLYGHLTSFLVKEGDYVFAGDPIGKSGGRPGTLGAGISTGPHLHLEVFQKGENVDPIGFLPDLPRE